MSNRTETQLALRAALARIAAEHPDMAEADEQGRLDDWLAAEHDADCTEHVSVLQKNA